MKIFDKLIYVFCFIAIATIYSCSDDTAALSTSYAKFSSSNFNASYSGTVNVFVEWSETEWEVSKEDGDVIASLSVTSGGNKSDKDQKTTIVVGLNENTSKSTREHKADNTQSEFTLYQESRYAKVASASFDTTEKYQYVEGFGGMYPPKGWVADPLNEQDIRKMYGDGDDQQDKTGIYCKPVRCPGYGLYG